MPRSPDPTGYPVFHGSGTGADPGTSAIQHRFPSDHWAVIGRFVVGDERDPTASFRLTDDVWDAVAYGGRNAGLHRSRHRVGFGGLTSVIKPYVKWYLYERHLLGSKPVSWTVKALPSAMRTADWFLVSEGIEGIDALATDALFDRLWEATLRRSMRHGSFDGAYLSRQALTRPFWNALHDVFGVPRRVPSGQPSPAPVIPVAFDTTKAMPVAVIRQLANIVALDRDQTATLHPADRIRMCVLLLLCVLGRRISEVLEAPRGSGPDGPLSLRPAKDGDALWFRMRPLKDGRWDDVYVSPAWEEVTRYCVRTILRSSDEVRPYASLVAADLFILVSRANHTIKNRHLPPTSATHLPAAGSVAIALQAWAVMNWLNNHGEGTRRIVGAMQRFGITVDGSADGEVFHLRSHMTRHTRQTVLAVDPFVGSVAARRDLNHRTQDGQLAYQHGAIENNKKVIERMRSDAIKGPGASWMASVHEAGPSPGQPSMLADRPRLQRLIVNNAAFTTVNRVPMGWCTLPQGPSACVESLLCAEARDGGCPWFAIDPERPEMLEELADRVLARRQSVAEAEALGHTVAADRDRLLADRAETLLDETLSSASADLRAQIRERLGGT